MAFQVATKKKLNQLPTELKNNLQQTKEDPSLFCNVFLKNPLKPSEPFEPTWYQKEFFDCQKRFVLINAGRQVGKSEMVVKYSIWLAYTKPRSKILFISASQRQASHLLHKVRQDIESSEILTKSVKRASRTEVHLDNGSMIISLPPSEATIRGYTADIVFIDEATHIHSDDLYYEVIMPMVIRTGGRIILTSTPYGKAGFFYEMYLQWNQDYERAKVFHFPAMIDGKPIAPGVDIKDLENQKKAMGPIRFSVEYLAEFVDDGVLFFPTDLVRTSMKNYDLAEYGLPEHEYYMGIDWGKQNSSTVVTIIKHNKLSAHRVVLIKEYKQMSYDQIIGHIVTYAERFNIRKCLADTGAGLAQIDQLKAMGLRIKGFNFTVNSKVDLFSNLRLMMETNSIELPANDKLKSQLISFSQKISPTGKMLLHAPSGLHDDYVDSLALAAYNLKKKRASFFVRKVLKPKQRFKRNL
jgi:phage FluMu gp28-like protein